MQYFQMIMALVGVLAIVFLLFWLMQKLNKRVTVGSTRNMKIIERINLGPDKMLLLISVCGKCMVLGVTANRAEKICDIDESEEELLSQMNQESAETSDSFKSVMEKMLNRKK